MKIEDQIAAALEEAGRMEREWDKSHEARHLDSLPTPWGIFNEAIGIGGIPVGYITEITGESYSGKSVLAWHLASTAQPETVIIADADRSTDIRYMDAVGLDPDAAIFLRSSSIRLLPEIIEEAVDNGAVAVILDSLNATLEARTLTPGDFHRICMSVHEKPAVMIIVNQKRHSPFDGFAPIYSQYMDKISPLRLDIKDRGKITQFGKVTGHKAHITTTRNRISNSFELKGVLHYGKGLSLNEQQ